MSALLPLSDSPSSASFSISNYISPTSGKVILQQLKKDLTDKVEMLYRQVQAAHSSPANFFLQKAANSLLPEMEKLDLNGKLVFENRGQCLGASEWLISLFLNCKGKYPEIPTGKLLTEIVKEFEAGMGIQPACIQKLYLENPDQEGRRSSLNFSCEQIAVWDYSSPLLNDANRDRSLETVKKITSLAPGVYLLFLSGFRAVDYDLDMRGHAVVAIVEDANSYFFDPNCGLAVLSAESTGETKKTNETWASLALKPYTPYQQTRKKFLAGLDKFCLRFSPKLTEEIKKIALVYLFEKDIPCFNAANVFDFFKQIRQQLGVSITLTEEEEGRIIGDLCVLPGLAMLGLESTQSVTVHVCK